MAFSINLTGIGLSPKDTWVEDMVCWWPDRDLMKDPRFREVNEDAGYVDYVAVLAPSEALEIHNQHARQPHHYDDERIDKLGKLLSQEAPALCWIFVNIYEWESGL